jgi:DNA-binding NtrC family response regulator
MQRRRVMVFPIIGISQSIKKIRALIRHAAGMDLNVIIYGERGVGKQLAAQNLYIRARRSYKSFVKINCNLLPAKLLQRELFGYQSNRIPEADQGKPGGLELARGGALYLADINCMSLDLQARFFDVLKHGKFSRLGSEKKLTTDTWVISSARPSIIGQESHGKFRKDLFFKLNIINMSIPPLRERREDIPVLIDYFMKRFTVGLDLTPKTVMPDKDIMKKLVAYPWPGNIDELQTILQKVLIDGNWSEFLNNHINNPTDEKDQTSE